MRELQLNGYNLTVEDIYVFIKDKNAIVKIAPRSLLDVEKSKKFLDREVSEKIVYGVNTGFGPMASHIISSSNLQKLQKNLILSHAVGMGEPIKEEYVISAMIVRLNTLLKGHSGVSVELVKRLLQFINNRIIPIVPEHGAVGTSGDLTQLAHIALALIGEGDVMYGGQRKESKDVMKKLNISPYTLQPKEGLALINGTSAMAGIGVVLCNDMKRILSIALRTGALSIELVNGIDDSLIPFLHQIRPHKGQKYVAVAMRKLLLQSHALKKRQTLQKEIHPNHTNSDVKEVKETIQEVYSFRCIPQILGPVLSAYWRTAKDITIEINSVTDNPIVDWKSKRFLHGGNFHGDCISLALDYLKISIIKLIMLSERRINFFLNHKINGRFPPFLNLGKPGLTLGLQGLQFVATSTTAHSQTLAFPQYVHSIPTNGDNQDVVSMGTDAALITARVIENAYIVIAIELITLAQSVDFLHIEDKLSTEGRMLFRKVRRVFPKLTYDRALDRALPQVLNFVKTDQDLMIKDLL